jgi:hypothetical protein
MTLEPISKQTQVELNQQFAVQAVYTLLRDLVDRAEWIAELSTQRLEDGFELYGDEMFWQEQPRLQREIDEELADAVNRRVVELARDAKKLPNPWFVAANE